MAQTPEGVNVVFGGDATGAAAAAQKAAEAVKTAVEGMRLSMEKLNSQFEHVSKGFAAISAAVAGGSALKEFVSKADEVTKSAVGMGKSLGISSTDASVFKSSLTEVGVSTDAVALAGKRITMALAQGGEKFKALGVETKDANGQFRNSRDIMLDVNEKLRGFREGTDRNIESMKIYGRSYQDLAPFINKYKVELEEEDMARAGVTAGQVEGMSASQRYALIQDRLRERAEALNLVVGQESVDASKKYNDAKRAMGEVMEGVQRTIGQALLPRLTEMAQWFNSVGPEAVSIMRGVMSTYLVIQDAIADSAKTVWEVLSGAFKQIGAAIQSVFGVGSEPMTGMQFFSNVLTVIKIMVIGVSQAFQLSMSAIGNAIEQTVDWFRTFGEIYKAVFMDHSKDAASAAWEAGFNRRKKIVADGMAALSNIALKGADDINKALETNPMTGRKETDTKDPKDEKGKTSTGKMGGKANTLAVLKAELDAAIALQKEMDAEAMRELEDRHKKELVSDQQFYEEKIKREQAMFDMEIDAKKKEQAELQKQKSEAAGDPAKLSQIAAKEIALKGQLQVLDLKRAAVAVDANREMANAETARLRKIEEATAASKKKLFDIAMAGEYEMLSFKKEMGQITAAEEIDAQRELLTRKYIAEKDAMVLLLANDKLLAAERTKIYDDLAALYAQHNQDMVANSHKASVEANAPWKAFESSLSSTFASGLNSMLAGTLSFGQALRGLWKTILQAFIQEFVVKKTAAWMAGETAKTGATIVGNEARTASDWFAAGQSVLATSWAAVKNIAAKAWEAAASVYESVAAIPVVGPFMAPVMAAAAVGTVIGFASHIASASGGYDIPAGVNPVTQLHQREMVLPAKHADVIRSMADGGGSVGAGSGGGAPIHIHGSPDDSIKLKDLGTVLRKMNRNFEFVK